VEPGPLIAAFGAICLGIVVGWLVRYILYRLRAFTPKTLAAILSVVFGGGILRLLGADVTMLGLYIIGVLLGFAVYTALALWALGRPSSRLKDRKTRYRGILYAPADNDESDELS
jgi:hypothetical protein